AAHMVGDDHPVVPGKSRHEGSEAEGPGGIPMEDQQGRALSLVQEVHPCSAHVQVGTGPGVELPELLEVDGAHHLSPIITEERPLPIPRSATRSPSERKACSSAMARLIGRATVPVFPKSGKVEKSFSSGTPSALRTLRRFPAPTWWQMTR